MSNNRITQGQPDYIFLIVRKPSGWRPRNYFDVPPRGEIVSKTYVASYAEAHDDLKRCNRLSLHHSLDTWAVIQAVEAEL
jgi:hypothetical protein